MTKLIAWHNDPELKTRTTTALHDDQLHDRYIRGTYAEILNGEWRGCHIGCLVMASTRAINHGSTKQLVESVRSTWHEKAEDLYGIPRALAYLWDRVYESVDKDAAPAFAVASVEAVPVGADLSLVVSHVMWDLLADPENGVRQYTEEGSRQREAVDAVAALYTRRLAGDEPTREEWLSGRRAAAAAAAADADAYAYAYAYAAAAAAAAYAGGVGGAYAYADAAAYAAAYARRGRFTWISERIIHHTQTAPTP